MSSRRRSIIKPSPKSEVFERIFSRDFYLKILFPSNIRLNSDDWFLAKGHISLKISSKDFLRSNPQKHPSNIRLNSDDPMDHGPPRYSTMSLTSRAENHLLVFLYPCIARAAVRGWQRQIHDIRRLTAVCGVADGKYLSAKSFLV